MDYTNMIKCALDGGASLDDIAKEFTDALNVFNKQNQVRKARQQALDEIECDFLNAVDDSLQFLFMLLLTLSGMQRLSLRLPELSG